MKSNSQSKKKQDISIKKIIITIFILSIIIITGIMTSIVFAGWTASSLQHAETMAMDLNEITIKRIDELMDSRLVLTDENSLIGKVNDSINISDLNNYLEDLIGDSDGKIFIVDVDTKEVIGESLENNKYIDLGQAFILDVFKYYEKGEAKNFLYEDEDDSFYTHFQVYQKRGLNWLIIVAMSKHFFIKDIINHMKLTITFVIVAIIITILIYYILMEKFSKILDKIIETTEELSTGNLSERIPIYRNDELGRISYSINKMADTISALINNLEATVQERTAELEYLSFHDALTGLLNRCHFESKVKILDTPENLPLSFIYADLDGLKMTNDIFGHDVGDELIIQSAKVLKSACRNEKDFAARIGGDEFVIVLPNTDEKEAGEIQEQIKKEFSKMNINAIKTSISLGFATKTSTLEDIEDILAIAEKRMYKDKTMNRTKLNSDLIQSIIRELHERSPREKEHSISVSLLCRKLAQSLKLPETDVKKLEQAGYLHDIGKIVLDPNILLREKLSKTEMEAMQQHSVIGYRILNLFDDTLDLAEGVYAHHECWDGSGYPKGLKGEEIPLEARIISIAEIYDAMTNDYISAKKDKNKALEEIKNLSGSKLDPEIVTAFIEMMDKTN